MDKYISDKNVLEDNLMKKRSKVSEVLFLWGFGMERGRMIGLVLCTCSCDFIEFICTSVTGICNFIENHQN